MPLYEYRCLKCKRHTEKIENMNGPHLKKCPHCGGKVESVITAPVDPIQGIGLVRHRLRPENQAAR